MALKIPPPPYFAVEDQFPGFNRWLLEVTSVLTNQGGIDPSEVAGLPELILQVGTNTADIATLEGGQGDQAAAIVVLQGDDIILFDNIGTINGQLTTLGARGELLFGTGAPAAGLGKVNDWYGDTAGAVGSRVWIKKAVGVWTAFPF
jgi:hypothetical protein